MKNLVKDRIILGIDPGTTIMGYGLINIINNEPSVITLGIIELKKYNNHYIKLQKIFDRTLQLIDSYHPDEISIEAPFFGKNVQSMLKLGRAQGVAMAAGLYRSIPIFEYAPLKIKLAITGSGSSSKEQVANFLKSILKLKEIPKKLDATDGLAAALCHFYQREIKTEKANFKNWKDFVNKNPDRIK